MFLQTIAAFLLQLQLLWMHILPVLQIRLSCLLRGAEGAEVLAARYCVTSRRMTHDPAIAKMHPLVTSLVRVAPDEKVLLHRKQHWTWHSLLLQLLRMLLLPVLQVHLWGSNAA